MSKPYFDSLDHIIALSLKGYVHQEAQTLQETEVHHVPDPKFTKKIERLIRARRNSRRGGAIHTFKVLAVACLILLSLAFAACVSIAELRECFWIATVEWGENYLSVYFPKSEDEIGEDQPPEAQPEEENKSEVIRPNWSLLPALEEINPPTYMPNGYTAQDSKETHTYYKLYYDAEGEYKYFFMQKNYPAEFQISNTDVTVHTVQIHQSEAVLIADKEGTLLMIWRDEFYCYLLSGEFESQEEIIRIAESVRPIT